MFIDDERDPPDDGNEWIIIRSFNEWSEWVNAVGHMGYLPNYVSFDHDLGEELNGYHIARDMVALDMEGRIIFQEGFDWYVHSQNPVGRDNINGLLKSFFNFRKKFYCEGS
jgi:hypothetical protein